MHENIDEYWLIRAQNLPETGCHCGRCHCRAGGQEHPTLALLRRIRIQTNLPCVAEAARRSLPARARDRTQRLARPRLNAPGVRGTGRVATTCIVRRGGMGWEGGRTDMCAYSSVPTARQRAQIRDRTSWNSAGSCTLGDACVPFSEILAQLDCSQRVGNALGESEAICLDVSNIPLLNACKHRADVKISKTSGEICQTK